MVIKCTYRQTRRIIVVGAFLFGISACATSTTTRLTEENDFALTLKKAGWTLLPIADSNYSPGVVVYFPKGQSSPRYIGPYSSCNVPTNKLALTNGTSPGLDTTKDMSADVNVAVKLAGVGGTATAGVASKATVKITDQGSQGLDLIGIEKWRLSEEGKAAFAGVCNSYFSEGGYYLINEGWVIRNGTMTFQSGPDASITVDPVKVNPNLTIGGGGNIKGIKDGTLTFGTSAFVAIRGVVPLKGGLGYLGPGGSPPETADARFQDWAQPQLKGQ